MSYKSNIAANRNAYFPGILKNLNDRQKEKNISKENISKEKVALHQKLNMYYMLANGT